MGKYRPLADFLATVPDDSWDATFAEIEGFFASSFLRARTSTVRGGLTSFAAIIARRRRGSMPDGKRAKSTSNADGSASNG